MLISQANQRENSYGVARIFYMTSRPVGIMELREIIARGFRGTYCVVRCPGGIAYMGTD